MNEHSLIKGILSGKEQYLRIFYEKYACKLTAFIRKRVNEEKDVEELVQDTLLASLEAFRDFTFRCTVSTYLCSIAKRKVVDYYRKKKIAKILFSQVPGIESLLAVLTTPEDTLDEKLLRQQIKLTLSRLTPRYRRILTLKYVEGCSVIEIAALLSTSFKSVESALFRARKDFVRLYSL